MALVTPKKSSFFDPPAQPAERPTQAPPAPTRRGGFFNQGPASRSGQSLAAPRGATPTFPDNTLEKIIAGPDSNMRFFAQICETPKTACSEFSNGRFNGTDINPMWRIRKLTEMFGPAGIGWWTEETYEFKDSPQTGGEVAVICRLSLFYIDPLTGNVSKPVRGIGGNMLIQMTKTGLKLNDDGPKNAYTDALSIAYKALGGSADIYYKYDSTKYTYASETAKANAAAAKAPAKAEPKPEPKAEPKSEPKTAAPAAPAAPQPEAKTPEASPTVTDVRQPSPNEVKARAQAKVMKILAGYKGSSPILPNEAEELTIALSEELGATINGGPDDGMNAMMEAVEELTKSGELPANFGFGSVPVSELTNYISAIRIYVQTRSSSAKKAAEDFFAVKKEAPDA